MILRRPSLAAPILIGVLFGASCTTYSTVPVERVALGDDIRVQTTDGEQLEFEVTFVGDQAIGGGGESVAVADIALIEVYRPGLARLIVADVLASREVRLLGILGLAVVIVLVAV